MKVYAIMSGEYDDYDIEGVYSTIETAEIALSHCPKSRGPFILKPPFEVDGEPTHYRKKQRKP